VRHEVLSTVLIAASNSLTPALELLYIHL